MKLSTLHGRKIGAALLVIIVLIFMLMLLGYTLWQILKMIRNLPTRPANQAQAAGEMIHEFQSEHPGETVSAVSTQVVTMRILQPFGEATADERIWRSTNTVNWEIVGTNAAGESWTDTNAPWPNGFYKREPISR